MSKLGQCDSCGGSLAVKTEIQRTGETTGYTPDGLPIRAIARDPDGVAIHRSYVACLNCGKPNEHHPFQKNLDEAEKTRQETRAKAAKAIAAAPVVLTNTSMFENISKVIEILQKQVAELSQNQEVLLAELSALKPNNNKWKTHASK